MSKRMFSDEILESDAFLDMPLTAQALYVHLNMNADHDGFVNPKRILRMVGGNDDDLRILIAKRFVLVFSSGVVVIKHWWINNTKRLDRHVPTTYQKELAELTIKSNNSYTENAPQLALETEVGNQMATNRQPLVAPIELNRVHVQENRIHVQPNGNQPATRTTKGFKKTITTPEQKRSYARAAQADRDQTERAKRGADRTGSTVSLSEMFRERKQQRGTMAS